MSTLSSEGINIKLTFCPSSVRVHFTTINSSYLFSSAFELLLSMRRFDDVVVEDDDGTVDDSKGSKRN